MRIGMMADIYKTQVSGVTHSIALSKQWLEMMGHDVYVFTFGDGEMVDDEKNIIRTSGVPLVDTGIYLNLRYNDRARRLLHTMDIAHVHHPFLSGSLAMRYCVPRNIPVIFTNHSRYDLYTQAYLPFLPEHIGEAALKAYIAPFYRACDLVIVPTPGMLEVLSQLGGADLPVDVIPNGVNLVPFKAVTSPIHRLQFGFSESDVVSVYLGRLAPEKNLPFLIRAFYGVAATHDNLRLLVVGDGPEREHLEDRVKHMNLSSKVHFTGMIDYQESPAYLAASDIMLTTSKSETFGLSTVEGMASGLPVLGIDAPGTADIIEDGVTGMISPDDVAAFSVKLALLATDHELRQRLGSQARKASEKYDIQTTTGLLLQHYQRLVEIAKHRRYDPRHRLKRLMDRIK